MKKYGKWILILVMVLIIPSLLPDCSCAYSGDTMVKDNLEFMPHSFAPRCFVNTLSWPEGQQELTLRIPDKVQGKRVTALGGFMGSGVPCPFMVDIPGLEGYFLEDMLPEDAVVEQYHLAIILGKNIREVKFAFMDHYYHMGENRFIQILVTVDLGENTYFGVQDGKLYCKADGEIVEGFFYASDYINQ